LCTRAGSESEERRSTPLGGFVLSKSITTRSVAWVSSPEPREDTKASTSKGTCCAPRARGAQHFEVAPGSAGATRETRQEVRRSLLRAAHALSATPPRVQKESPAGPAGLMRSWFFYRIDCD